VRIALDGMFIEPMPEAIRAAPLEATARDECMLIPCCMAQFIA